MQKTFVLLVPWFVSGGADKCGLDLLRFYQAQGWRTVAIATREHAAGNVWRHKFDEVCDEVVDLGIEWRAGGTSARIRDIVLRIAPTIVCVNNSHEGYDCARMIFEIMPSCLMSCLVHMELPGAWDFTGQLISGQHRWFHRIITVSTHLAKLMEAGGVPEQKLFPLHWFGYAEPPDERAIQSMRAVVRRELQINPNQFTVLFPSRLEEQKQPHLIPKIAKSLLANSGNPIFIVAGSGRQSARVRAAVERDGTAANFRFLGGVDPENMPALYAASDVLCLPSLDEGVPLVMFEAMQMLLPIVGSDVGAVSELVIANQTGLLVPRGTHQYSENYAQAIRWIMNNRPQAATMARQAAAVVGGRFSHGIWQQKVIRAFTEISLPAAPMLKPRTAPIEKVFVIGAPRTGTSSVGKALATLGYRDYGHDPYLQELWAHGCYEPIWERVGMYDSFSDGPFNTGDFYKVLAERYPRAKFVLSVREKQAWKRSHQRHFDPAVPNPDVKERFKLHRYEPEIWWRWYDRRNAEIRAYFQTVNRPHHLLELTIGQESDPWGRLADFLGPECVIPSPLPDFPHVNKTP